MFKTVDIYPDTMIKRISKMRRYIYSMGLLVLSLMAMCHNNDKMKNVVFNWQVGMSAPAGFPMTAYSGGFISESDYIGFSPVTVDGG